MSEFNKYSTDGGATFIDVEDSNAVHYGEQSKGYVGKNLIPFPYINGDKWFAIISGITFIVNNDGSITVNGSNPDNAVQFQLWRINGNTLPFGSYTISGVNLSSNIQLQYWATADFDYKTTGSDVTFTINDNNHASGRLTIIINKGNTFNNLTIYPMLRVASVTDNTFESPLPNNNEITVYNNSVGGKNILNVDNAILATNIISSIDNNGIISFKNATSVTWSNSYIGYFDMEKDKTYVITTSNLLPMPCYRLGFSKKDDEYPKATNFPNISDCVGGSAEQILRKDRVKNQFTANESCRVYVWVCTDYNYSDKQAFDQGFMIRDIEIADETYVSNAMTNRVLTEMVKVNCAGSISNTINTLLSAQSISNISCTNATFSIDAQRTFFSLWFDRADTSNAINDNIDLSSILPYKNKYWTGGCVAVRDGDSSGMWWIDTNSTILRIRVPQGNNTILVSGYIQR